MSKVASQSSLTACPGWAPDQLQISKMRSTNRHFYADYYKRRLLLSLRYDYIYRKRILRRFLTEMGITAPRAKVLDAGFGNGDLLFTFDRSCELHGLEISRSAVQLAQHQAQKRGYANCRFTEHDLHELVPHSAASFDLVICSHVLEHIENDEALLADFRRVLRKDGRLFVFIPIHEELVYANGAKHIQKYTCASFRRKAERCGFRVAATIEHQFFDRPFKLFAPFARRYAALDAVREVIQYSFGFVAVHTCAPVFDRLFRSLGFKPTSLFLMLEKVSQS